MMLGCYVQHGLGEPLGVMANPACGGRSGLLLGDEAALDDPHAQLLQLVPIKDHWLRALLLIAPTCRRRDGCRIHQNVVE